MRSDGVTPELLFGFVFFNSPEMTVDNVGASVHLSLGKTFVPVISQNYFISFSYVGHMLEIVTSEGIVPGSDCSYGILIRTYACCYSSLLIMGFSLSDYGIGANRFYFLIWCRNRLIQNEKKMCIYCKVLKVGFHHLF